MRSKAELAVAVLQQGALIASDESVTAADQATIVNSYDSKLPEWRRRGYIWWDNVASPNTDSIPDEAFSTLVLLIFNDVRSAFGLANEPMQQVMTEDGLLRQLKRINHKPPSGEATPFSVF